MPKEIRNPVILHPAAGTADCSIAVRLQQALLKTVSMQNATLSLTNFSAIATDAKGIIKIFTAGAEHMLGYSAADVINRITPADIFDQQEVIARAKALTAELGATITSGFEALVFNALRGIDDNYELTYICKDGSRFPAVVSATALRDDQDAIIGYLLIGTQKIARKRAESGRTLLYIEDNLASLKLLEQLIARQHDMRLLTAANGNSGIEIARASQPDVILMDINLPDISGFKALQILQADPATAHIPVIAISANVMPLNMESGMEAGFFRYLTKPIKFNEFMDALDVALEFAGQNPAKSKYGAVTL
jgi:CheY-like chemotaxis protein